MKNKSLNQMSRRCFIGTSAAAIGGITVIPVNAVAGLGHVAPSDKLNVAAIGIGGKGKANLRNIVDQNIVALCDVDWDYAEGVFKTYPKARKWKDFRQMFERQKDIDAVLIATPDHNHAIQAMTAMQLGKHVYCQKPLTHSVWEARQLTMAAKKYRVATQMGNEGHSSDAVRQVAELVQNGVIGEVREVHATTNRPIWPQGLERPDEVHKVPDYLDWDLFIGPAPFRPYNEAYHPWSWRAWWDFGTGALGDMACHVLDVPFYALNLKYPLNVQASSSVVNTESAPQASQVTYIFPARQNFPWCAMPEVKVVWHDGGFMPERSADIPDGISLTEVNLYIGTKGKIITGNYGADFKVLINGYTTPPETLLRVPDHPLGGGRHEMDWVRACKENPESRIEAASNFAYSGPLTEMVVMGNLAIRLQGINRVLNWDGENMKITNIADNEKVKLITSHQYKSNNRRPQFKTDFKEVNAQEFAVEMIKHNYREGWTW